VHERPRHPLVALLARLRIETEDGRSIEATPGHPFWVEGKGFITAKHLARSDLLRGADGRSVRVTQVSTRNGEFTVYNFEVAGTHTYYAGGWWVHNQCGLEITADEIRSIASNFGGTELTGQAESALGAAAYREGFWNKSAAIVREIAGRHMFSDGNKRTAQAVVEALMDRHNIRTGVSPDQMRKIILRVGSGELRDVKDIARALRGF
jgi:prophage maintenance system killer protein